MAIDRRLTARSLAQLLGPPDHRARPHYRWLADSIAALLLDGRIGPDTWLPSERDLAAQLGLSRTTTTAAYRQLAAAGLLVSRRGAGSALRLPPGAAVAGPGARIRRAAAQHGDPVLDLSTAALPAEAATLTEAVRAAADELASHARGTGYQPYGLPALRTMVAEWFQARGVPTRPGQILITNGAQHATDLILRTMLAPGERVLTELPCYPGALDAVQSAGGRVVTVPFAAAGDWDVSAMAATMRQATPSLAILVPDFHNPTGVLIPTEQREAAFSAARRAGTTVIIDESFVELDLRAAGHATALPSAALDPSVLSVGSMSKPFWGGLRVGWIRADENLVGRVAATRARADLGGSLLDQLTAGHLLRHRARLLAARRSELRRQRDALLEALRDQLPQWQPSAPVGGLSTWVQLDVAGATGLASLAEECGVLVTPGSRFTRGTSLERFIRVPYTLPPDLLVEAVRRLAEAWSRLDRRPPLQESRPSGLVSV